METAVRESAFQVVQNGDGEILNLASNVCKLASEIRNKMIGPEPPRMEKDCEVRAERAFSGYAGRMVETHRSIANTLLAAIRDLEALNSEIPSEKPLEAVGYAQAVECAAMKGIGGLR